MDYASIAEQILHAVGGPGNVKSVVHCMTRLRFVLRDNAKIDDEVVKSIKGVVGVMRQAGQYQIIIGNDVAHVYTELNRLGSFADQPQAKPQEKTSEKKGIVARLMDVISGVMAPVIPPIMGAAMVRILITLLHMVGILSKDGTVYYLLNIIGDAAFYFFPALVAVSAAKQFGANPYYAAGTALVLVHPDITTLLEGIQQTSFLTFLPTQYAYTIFPIIFAVWVQRYIEQFADRVSPKIAKNFLQPLLVVLICALLALFVLGPLGAIVGDMLTGVIYWIRNHLGFVAVGVLAGIYPFIVMAGVHHALTPIKLGVIASVGFENFICISELCANMAQGAAAAAVAVRSRNRKLKQAAAAAAVTGLFAGITEPALYGVTIKLKRPMLGACLGAAVGGLFGGFVSLKCFGIATPAVVSILQYVEDGHLESLLFAALTILVTAVATFVFTLLIGFEDIVETPAVQNTDAPVTQTQTQIQTPQKHEAADPIPVYAPLQGRQIALSEVHDATFSSEVLGKGAAIIPVNGEVRAPFDGTVTALFETGHAIGLKGDSGIEVLIHVGIDTVNLKGKFFHPTIQNGDIVHTGDLLLTFDRQEIIDAGYDVTTPVIVTNTQDYSKITVPEPGCSCGENTILLMAY